MSAEKSNVDRLFWALTIIGFLVGLVGLKDRLTMGHAGANYGSYIPWGLWVAGYIYLMGISAGAFVMSSIVYVFRVKALAKIGPLALLTALATLIGSLVMVWMDLGHMGRVLRMVTNTNFGSVMGWMPYFYGAYLIVLLIQFWTALRTKMVQRSRSGGASGALCGFLTFGRTDLSETARENDARRLRILGMVGLPLAVAFYGSEGGIFGVVGARPYWNSGLTPILFLVGALLSGAAMVAMVHYVWGGGRGTPEFKQTMLLLGNIVLGLLAFDVLLEWAEFSVGMWSSLPSESESFRMILFGPYSWVFWFVHVALGVVIPGLLLLFKRSSGAVVAWAGGLIGLTFISVRLNIVLPGLAVPELEGLRNAFHGPGLNFDYFPSVSEWLLFVFSVSLAALLFMIGKTLLPVVDSELAGSAQATAGSGEASR